MKNTIIPQDVLTALSAATFEGNELRLGGTLDRGVYARLKKVVEAAGGKWVRGAAAHVFPGDAAEAIEPLLLTGAYVRPGDMGQFDSPPAVVERVIEEANIREGDFVLEPSAGTGNLFRAARDAGGVVRAVEIDPKRVAALRAIQPRGIRQADFLSIDPDALPKMRDYFMRFDRIVMNPPFAPAQADIDHVLHAIRFLKPGGRIVAVMSAGILFRQNKKTTRFVEAMNRMAGYSIEELPENSFKMSGTNVNTVIVTANKPEEAR